MSSLTKINKIVLANEFEIYVLLLWSVSNIRNLSASSC